MKGINYTHDLLGAMVQAARQGDQQQLEELSAVLDDWSVSYAEKDALKSVMSLCYDYYWMKP